MVTCNHKMHNVLSTFTILCWVYVARSPWTLLLEFPTARRGDIWSTFWCSGNWGMGTWLTDNADLAGFFWPLVINCVSDLEALVCQWMLLMWNPPYCARLHIGGKVGDHYSAYHSISPGSQRHIPHEKYIHPPIPRCPEVSAHYSINSSPQSQNVSHQLKSLKSLRCGCSPG